MTRRQPQTRARISRSLPSIARILLYLPARPGTAGDVVFRTSRRTSRCPFRGRTTRPA